MNMNLVQLGFFFSTFISISLIDQIGRKMLMLDGTGLMAITLFLPALAFQSETPSGVYVLFLAMLYIGTFVSTLGTVVWVLISEMYLNEIRGRACGLTSSMLWLSTFLVVLVSPPYVEHWSCFQFCPVWYPQHRSLFLLYEISIRNQGQDSGTNERSLGENESYT